MQLAFNLETGEQVAIKFIERGPHIQRTVARELLNHRLCALHPHIIQLKVRPLTTTLGFEHVPQKGGHNASGLHCDCELSSPFQTACV